MSQWLRNNLSIHEIELDLGTTIPGALTPGHYIFNIPSPGRFILFMSSLAALTMRTQRQVKTTGTGLGAPTIDVL